MATDPHEVRAKLVGVILAAGASRRMGQPKQLLPLHGRPLLQHALDAAAAATCLDEIVLVLGADAPGILASLDLPETPPVQVAINPTPEEGQSSSLRVGLRAAAPDAAAAAILLGDQPGMTGARIDRVAGVFESDGKPVVRPVYSGSRGEPVPGHPVLVARRVWPEVEKLSGDEGLRGLVARHPEWLRTLAWDEAPLDDVDDRQDYEAAGGTPDPEG